MHLLATTAATFLLAGFTPIGTEPHGGTVLEGSFPGGPRPGYVYLPPGFSASRRYPVLYLLHGLPGGPVELVNGTGFGPFADAAIAAGSVAPFIAVMPAAGSSNGYAGEWAGRWETALVRRVVPWVDAHLPTIASPAGRVIAGLSAGGFGAVDIALRHSGLFGTAESWSGYFTPLRDGPFRHATPAELAAHDPVELVRRDAPALRAAGLRFFVSTGPAHSRLIDPAGTGAFARELRSAGLPVRYEQFAARDGEWSRQVEAGITWAFAIARAPAGSRGGGG